MNLNQQIKFEKEREAKTGFPGSSEKWEIIFKTDKGETNMTHICSAKRVKTLVLEDCKKLSSPITVEIFRSSGEKVFTGKK